MNLPMTVITHNGVTLREIPRWPDYYAGEDGHIYSDKADGQRNGRTPGIRQLKEQTPKKAKGLRKVTLYRADLRYDRRMPDGSVKSCVRPQIRYVHRLIAAAWLAPQPSPQHEIDHIDECRANNRPTNLQWLTKSENSSRWMRNHPEHRLPPPNRWRGTMIPNAKLTDEKVRLLRRLKGVMGSGDAGTLLNVSASTVKRVWRGDGWAHVTDDDE